MESPKLEVVKFLEQFNDPSMAMDALQEQYGIRYRLYDDRVVLNYDQIESHKYRYHPIVKECRSLILSFPEWNILSRSFDRFFNYLQENLDDQDLSMNDAVVYEKLDGSLMNVYHDGEKWCVSSRSMAYAEGPIGYLDRTLRDLFDEAIGTSDLESVFINMHTDLTFIFELVSPHNRIITRYPETRLYLLTIRSKVTGWYFNDHDLNEICEELNLIAGKRILRPKMYICSDMNDVIQMARDLPTLEEGYVCVWKTVRGTEYRVKVKNPSYLAVMDKRCNGRLTEKCIAELVTQSEYEEYLTYFPEDEEIIRPWINAWENVQDTVQETYKKYKDIESQKEFALKVKDSPLSGFYFRLRQGSTFKDIVDSMSLKTKLQILEAMIKIN